MISRTTRSHTISNDEIGSQTHSRLPKLLQHHNHHLSQFTPAVPSPLYLACQNNDVAKVKDYLTTIKYKEIDCQYSPNNETVLHVATRNQQKEIIEILLSYGAQRSLRNTNGQQAHELAETKEIKDLFERSKSSRFTFRHSYDQSQTTPSVQHNIKCESCSLINDHTFYEWELIDRNATQKALRFRRELKPFTSMSEKDLKQKLYSIKKGYINTRVQHALTNDGTRIHDYFKRALLELEPHLIVTAYTASQSFSELLNKDMARNVIHDLKNGCSKFSCDCLYSTEDGTKSITNIFFHHPKFQKLSFKGTVYRGIIIPKNSLDHYKVGSCILTTTFLSTSTNPEVAQSFCDKGIPNSTTHSFFCIYEIFNEDHTALNISTISEFKNEDEILILPYSAFLITMIEEKQDITYIYLKEQCLTNMIDISGTQEYSLKSTVRLLELVGSRLVHNIGDMILNEDNHIRPRSKTMPVLNTYL
ncbi:unnamed protein product [Adineta steineri]|uniref:NAD(P)(+)--arginine ADP-ribosyltransferase n=1 Tax=Adineta steineri TaxID=433720 RepID=A0A819J6M6_9BILA|nr:unnamed protein product [Adineta steineri]CAF3927699.1 unnamed protein product [Adineta steineri]